MADVAALHQKAKAERWGVTLEVFAQALERSSTKAFAGRAPSSVELDRYYHSLHLAELALACACGEGNADAWDHFVMEYRPALYRAADAIDRTGSAREIADSLYGDLYSRSLFRYFHGRSSLATWLRSLISQRYVDRLRETKRLEPLADERDQALKPSSPHAQGIDDHPDRARFVTAMQAALAAVIASLEPRDRLRLRCYYAEGATLAQIGRVTRESEATVSRQLARTRKVMRGQIETRLQREHGFSADEARDCISSMMDDAGTLDLGQLLEVSKKAEVDRSKVEEAP
jgi:RNA polymerase sigma factor (sigma-70 family)